MADLQRVDETELDNIYGIELLVGEVICPKCNGKDKLGRFALCDRCWGTGKLDWIELAMGKEMPFQLSGTSASSSRSSTAGGSSRGSSRASSTAEADLYYNGTKKFKTGRNVTEKQINVTVKPPNATKRRNVNGSNSQFGFGTIKRLSEMFNKSKGGLQRRRHKIRRRKTKE